MNVGQHCKRNVVWISPDTTLTDAAKLMRDRSIGLLVIAEERGARRVPIGVLTDRDIVVQVIGSSIDPQSLLVKDVMSTQLVLASEEDDFMDLVRGMRAGGIRRVPVVDRTGALIGIVALDDALEVVSEMLEDLCGAVRNEQRIERLQHRGA
jgi:CBS domain-containing protein